MQSKYGVKISNYQASSVWDKALGVRTNYNTTPAMLTNSLFLDFLMENGLKVNKQGFTRDVICLQFDSGSDSYKMALDRINKAVEKNRIERKRIRAAGHKLQIEKIERSKHTISERKRFIENHEELFDRKSANELREIYYINGIDIEYKTRGDSISTVHYKMLYRTPGKAKKGTVMFIRAGLWKKAHNFLWMGLKLPKKNAPIVEIGAYSSLVTSTIEDRLKIDPAQILVLKDVESSFITNVISIEIDEAKHCHAVHRDNYEVKNVLFDGQALIDTSIFPDWGNGYVLLRHHFFKAAAFHAHIQDYFRDYFGDDYETATVTDMWGNEHLARDIKLITTENAIKWIKFGVTYEYWSDRVRENDSMFGIVKTAHESKLGDKQRMSYQMVNAMALEDMDDIMADTKDYVYKLKTDDSTFFDHLRRNANFCNDFEVLLGLCEWNPDFIRSEYCVERRQNIVKAYVRDVKGGHVLQNADNLVIVGNPYGMLMHAVGLNAEDDPTFETEDGCIQCYTERFDDGEYLAEFRSPFNSCNNLGSLHNVLHPLIKKYFDFGRLIIAVNGIHTPFQDRNNGSDADSDSLYVTNQSSIVARAKYCYINYPTVVNNIPKEKNIYNNVLKDYALVDNKLAAAQLDIGESSNIAQIGLSYSYNMDIAGNQIETLAVLAQCAIDNAKRSFDIDIHSEIQRIKQELNIKSIGYPAFFAGIRPDLRNKVNPNIVCPMNCVYKMKNKTVRTDNIISNSEFFISHKNPVKYKTSRQIEKMIENYSLELFRTRLDDETDTGDYLLLRSDYDDLINDLRRVTISKNYMGLMSWLINRSLLVTPQIQGHRDKIDTKLSKNRPVLLKILWDMSPKNFKKCFKRGGDIVCAPNDRN